MSSTSSSFQASSQTLLYSLSTLKDKVQQAQSLVSSILSPNQFQHLSLNTARSSVGLVAQDIIAAASSMMPVFQQLASDAASLNSLYVDVCNDAEEEEDRVVIELEADDLLAKYTHFCQVCSKGFKRDGNLRMHMRAHGDEYKTNTALRNPYRHGNTSKKYYYSCPKEGCKWNKKHGKFQPLKSLVCAKNHYKRSHCPKMYVCKHCDSRQYAVLSDLRAHEKHCRDGEVRWR